MKDIDETIIDVEVQQTELRPSSTLQGGKYRIAKKLGQGGFGITYLGVQENLDRQVAIKEFFMRDYCNRDTSTSHVSIGTTGSRELVERFRQKFMREAKTIARLRHKGIVEIYDVFEENGTAYYVMEFVEGASLKEYVSTKGCMAEPAALNITRQIGDALAYMHARNMLHLDVKPANIMMRSDGTSVLIDFGMSKHYADGGEATTTSPIAKSKGYAPKEQYSQDLAASLAPNTDIYALGATLYYMLEGKAPMESIARDSDDDIDFKQSISAETRKAILSAMRLNRKKRAQTVEEFISMLDKQNSYKDEEANTEEDDTIYDRKTSNDKTINKQENNNIVLKKSFRITAVIVPILIVSFGSLNFLKQCIAAANLPDLEMIAVEGGTFMMGSNSDVYEDEKPVHQVTVNSFQIGKYEVTQRLWKAVMGNNPSKFKGDNLPVENVSWNDTQEFIRKLNEQTGRNYRLPSEAEWEFAARGGNKSKGYMYSGNNNIYAVAWSWSNGHKTHPVGTKQPNELGLYDMSGNVWEWCQDWYGNYNNISQTNPTGSSFGSNHVIRGGGWCFDAYYCRPTKRYSCIPNYRYYGLGFRLAL